MTSNRTDRYGRWCIISLQDRFGSSSGEVFVDDLDGTDVPGYDDAGCDDSNEGGKIVRCPEDMVLEIVVGEENIDESDGSGIGFDEIPRPEDIMHYIVNEVIRDGRKVKERHRH